MEPDTTLGDRIRIARSLQKMSQATLARRIGISKPSMSAIERGTDPRASRIKAIAEELCVSADWLLDRKGEVFLGYGPPR